MAFKQTIAAICALAALTLAASRAQTATPSFLCSQATTWVERFICNDDTLAARDLELAEVYARLLRQPDTARRAQLEREQRQWWATRARCQSHPAPGECLLVAYQARITALRGDALYPGDSPVRGSVIIRESSVKAGGLGWTRHLSEYARAIGRCRADARVPVTAVHSAWPEDRGENVAMWMRAGDGHYLLCLAGRRGEQLIRLRPQEPGETLPVTEASLSLAPMEKKGACAGVPVLDVKGQPFGWVVPAQCAVEPGT